MAGHVSCVERVPAVGLRTPALTIPFLGGVVPFKCRAVRRLRPNLLLMLSFLCAAVHGLAVNVASGHAVDPAAAVHHLQRHKAIAMMELNPKDTGVIQSAERSTLDDIGVVTPTRRSTDISPAADKVHVLGPLAGSAMPPAYAVDDPKLEDAHSFSKDASWLIPGYVLCGSYPGACPGRPQHNDLAQVRDTGVSTFVCLQEELPPQDAPWPENGVPNLSERAKFAAGNFLNYRSAAGEDASYVHFGLPDLSVCESLDSLDEIVCDLRKRIEAGDKLYIHCWGGRGRTGLIAACLLGSLYGDMDAEEALQRVQCYYDLRQPLARDFSAARKTSPETDEQKNQVRDWYSYKRIIGQSAVPATSGKRSKMSASSYHIKARGSSEIIEEVCASAIHPLTLADALVREKDADILGKGQFGKVFRGSSDMHGEVAIKVMPDGAPTHEQSRLALEAVILRTMSGKRGFPTLYYDARQTIFGQKSDVLVMSLLGKPVESTLGTHGAEHSATVLKIGRDIIQCLRSLHGAGYIHNDIKPLNILFGVPGSDRQEDAHLLDFGTATCTEGLEDPDGCLVPVDETTTLTAGGGTPLYASLAQLEGRPTRPVDDIESLW